MLIDVLYSLMFVGILFKFPKVSFQKIICVYFEFVEILAWRFASCNLLIHLNTEAERILRYCINDLFV